MTDTAAVVRRATLADMPAVARIHRAAFFGAMPDMPALHTAEEDLAFYSKEVFPACEVWLAEQNGVTAGFIAYRSGWVDHLYVDPGYQGRGFGSLLLALAKEQSESLRAWTFQCNLAARRFYERHAFRVERETDGRGNEEQRPDVLYVWRRA
jgi:ribosomal protein S18 acetylase RimI-like enzyme